jgi:hypothetical protein
MTSRRRPSPSDHTLGQRGDLSNLASSETHASVERILAESGSLQTVHPAAVERMNKALAENPDRALDVLGAEKIMGWIKIYYDPKRGFIGWESVAHYDARSVLSFSVPLYTTDAAADADLLRKVREDWGSGRLQRMQAELDDMWSARWGYGADVPVGLRYLAGDFSRAAAKVLLDE